MIVVNIISVNWVLIIFEVVQLLKYFHGNNINISRCLKRFRYIVMELIYDEYPFYQEDNSFSILKWNLLINYVRKYLFKSVLSTKKQLKHLILLRHFYTYETCFSKIATLCYITSNLSKIKLAIKRNIPRSQIIQLEFYVSKFRIKE